jgi:hypothetical protein
MARFKPHHAAIGFLFATVACGGGGGGSTPEDGADTTQRPRATSDPNAQPAGTAAPAKGVALLEFLPVAGDIKPLELGIPTVQAIRDPATALSASPAGPCGAAIAAPPLTEAAGRTYESPVGIVVALALPRGPEVDAFVEGLRADLTDGCAGHSATAPDGSPLTFSSPTTATVTEADAFAWTSTIEDPAPPKQRATVVVQSETVAVLVHMTGDVVDPAVAQTISTIWSEKLAA